MVGGEWLVVLMIGGGWLVVGGEWLVVLMVGGGWLVAGGSFRAKAANGALGGVERIPPTASDWTAQWFKITRGPYLSVVHGLDSTVVLIWQGSLSDTLLFSWTVNRI